METTRFRYKAFRKAMLADLHTPVDVYLKLRDLSVQSVLMECSDYHDAANSRSFIALCPLAHIAVGHGVAELQLPSGQTVSRTINGSCRTEHAFRQFLSFFDIEGEGSEYCGLYGYTSFNAVRYFENIEVKDETMDLNDAPDILYTLFRDVLVFDHFNNELSVVTLLPSAADAGEAERRLSEILGTIDHGKPQLFPSAAWAAWHPRLPTTSTAGTYAAAYAIVFAATCFRLCFRAASCRSMRATTSSCTVPCEASTPRPISSISTSAASAS